jgi:hypothetical protein
MEPTSSPDNGRQSRGLARFWPVHGLPAPTQRQSGEDGEDASEDVHEAGEQPADESTPAAGPFGPTVLTGDTQMVALGSRRTPEVANGGRVWNQGGFPPPDSERGFRNSDVTPRHGGAPVPNGLPPTAGVPLPPAARPPFGPVASAEPPPFVPASPFAPHAATRGTAASSADNGSPQAAGPAQPAAGETPPPAQYGRTDEGPAEPPSGPRVPDAPTSRGAASVPVAGQNSGRDEPVGGAPQDGSPMRAEQPVNGRMDANGWVDPPGRIDPGARIDANGRVESNGPIALGGAATSNGRSDASNGRAEMPAPRPAAGWASVPTSGIPTIAGSAPGGPAAAGTASVAAPPPVASPAPVNSPGRAGTGSAAATPLGGSPVLGPPLAGSPVAAPGMPVETLPGGGRRSREDDEEEGRLAARRRSTTLDDADPLPRTGRRAAPETGDPADARTDAAAGRPDTGRAGSGTDSRADAPLRPGDVTETQIAFWDDEAVTHFRSQWHEVKAEFVDDPVTALTRAHDLLTEAVNELTESLLAERDELDPLQTTSTPDTESMRMAMRGYREFLDRILAL